MAESSHPESTYALPERLIRWRKLVNVWSTNRYRIGFLSRSHRPVGPMVCPARFERATYALEAVKMRLNNTKNNGIEVLGSGVA